MNKKEYIKSIVKGPKESFGTNPKDPWSAKANIAESGLLDRFLKSKGIDPRFVSTDSKISHSKSGEFIKWKKDRFLLNSSFNEQMDGQGGTTERQMRLNKRKAAQDVIPTPPGPGSHNEEVEIDEASSAAQQAAIAISMKKRGIKPKNEEVELEEDHVAIAMGKQLDDEGSMALNQLDMMERAVRNLRLVIKDPTMQLPAWVQSKITLAADYMDTVAHYMSSRNEDGMNESSYSAKPVDRSPTKRELERKIKPPKSEYERKVEKYLKKKYAKEEVEINEGMLKKVVASAALAAAAASPHAHAQEKEPTQHASNPHLVAHVEHEGKVHRFDLEKMFKSHEHAREHMSDALKRHGMTNHIMHITNKSKESELPTYAAKHKDYMDKTPAVQKVTHGNYSDNSPAVGKHSSKNYMSTESVQDKLHAKHQELRKKSGLPHPDYYKELKATYDLPDEERFKKAAELKKKYGLKEDMYQDTYAATQTVSDGGNTPDDVVMKKERSKSARIIKSIYKKKQMKEDIYDHEKDDKSIETPGKKPKITKVDKDVGSISSTPQAFAVMQGGKTLTGQARDTIEIDPLLRVRPGQVEPTVKKAEKK